MKLMTYREDLANQIVGLIVEQNGGRMPGTIEELEQLFPRFGARVEWVVRDILPEPMIRGKVVYVPDVRPSGRMLRSWLVHELAEVVLSWEGTRQWQGPGWHMDQHRIATLVERQLLWQPVRGVSRREV